MTACNKKTEKEWRALVAQLNEGKVPELQPAASIFDDPGARRRVGDLITRAVLGDRAYALYRLYYGDPASEL
jgi:hypothetical protein